MVLSEKGKLVRKSQLVKSVLSNHGSFVKTNLAKDDLEKQQVLAAQKDSPKDGNRHGIITAQLSNLSLPLTLVEKLSNIPNTKFSNQRFAHKLSELADKVSDDTLADGIAPLNIEVGFDGHPFVFEEISKLQAYSALGVEEVPVAIKWFAGGENVSGLLSQNAVALHLANTPKNPNKEDLKKLQKEIFSSQVYRLSASHEGYVNNCNILEYVNDEDEYSRRFVASINGYQYLLFQGGIYSDIAKQSIIQNMVPHINEIVTHFEHNRVREALTDAFTLVSTEAKKEMLIDREKNGYPKDIEALCIFNDAELLQVKDEGFITDLVYANEVFNREFHNMKQSLSDGDIPFNIDFKANIPACDLVPENNEETVDNETSSMR